MTVASDRPRSALVNALRSSGIRMLLAGAVALQASGCTMVATTLASVGAGVGANHFIGSVNYRTFTEPAGTLKRAAGVALRRMKIDQLAGADAAEAGEGIRAKTSGRVIEIDFEVLTPSTTRMRAVVRMEGSLLLDAATSQEIIAQTEKVLAASPRTVQAAGRN